MNFESADYKTKDAPDLNDFDWSDPFKLSELFEEHEVLIKESAASFANDVPRLHSGVRIWCGV